MGGGGSRGLSWIVFEEIEPAAKTKRWQVITATGRVRIGVVKWFGRWRRYAFFPDPATIYESSCLADLADFCLHQTANRRKR